MTAHDSADGESPRFIADCHLGRLAKYLRFMGYDTLYFPHIEDRDLVALARKEARIVLTRDTAMVQRKNAPVFFLKPQDSAAQIRALSDAFGIRILDDAYHRCLVCNARLEAIGKTALKDTVPAAVKEHFDFFQQCPECGRVYWHGDHYQNMTTFLRKALGDVDRSAIAHS